MKILLVDDDELFRDQLAQQLRLYEEFTVKEATTGSEALAAVKRESFDASLLDVGLPDMDGREICRLFRRTGVTSPILMLSAADSDADTILGLDAGANDYLAKPFKISVLLARLRAHVRQHQDSVDAVFNVGPYVFQPGTKLLLHKASEKKIWLTEKETMILKRLYRSRNQVVSRDMLLEEVWGFNAAVTTHTLETHIYRMRQKIEPDPAHSEYLITESSGYRLIA